MAGVLPSVTDLATLRTLEEFKSPEEILIVLRDVTEVHKQNYITSGTLHRSISPSTIFISDSGRGLLPYPRHDNLYCLPANPIFASVSSLATSVLKRKKVLHVDYLDDLESMYYTLIFLATAYRGPGKPMTEQERAAELSHTLSVWINDGPLSSWSVLEKEVALLAQGFGYGTVHKCFVPFVFETLFEHLHDVLHVRYVAKIDELGLGERVDSASEEAGAPVEEETKEEKMATVVEDYDAFVASFDYALEALQEYRSMQDTGVIPASLSHLFAYTEAPATEVSSSTEATVEVAKNADEGSLLAIADAGDESDDSSSGSPSLEGSPVEENDAQGDCIKRGLDCADDAN
ncbi:hypothetical protein BJ165DRAFT_1428915 [Panaeolus papilionaceus]|nr:hypothetical protein BJ165DRAFT_1428915 [Panaeolus papilionaceus]